MISETIYRARTIIKRNDVVVCADTVKPFFIHFMVKQRTGDWTDVWYKKNRSGFMEWECNSKHKTWGCVMNNKLDKSKPFCSHTLAAKMKLDKLNEMI